MHTESTKMDPRESEEVLQQMIVHGTQNKENDSVDTDAHLNLGNEGIGVDPENANEDKGDAENANESTSAPNVVSKSIDVVTFRMNWILVYI